MIDQALLTAFMDAGVPKRLAKEGRLTDLPNMGEVLAFIRADGIIEIMVEDGTGVMFEGDAVTCDDAVHYIVKSAVARAVEARVYTMVELVRELALAGYHTECAFWNAEMLAISVFEDPHYPKNPFSEHQRVMVESALMQFIRSGRPIIIHREPECAWWSKRRYQLIHSSTRRFVL